jgi:hypothetical protein
VDGTPVGLDRRDGDGAVLVADDTRLLSELSAVLDRGFVCFLGVEDGQRDVLDAVAVELDLLGGRVVLGERGRQQERMLPWVSR